MFDVTAVIEMKNPQTQLWVYIMKSMFHCWQSNISQVSKLMCNLEVLEINVALLTVQHPLSQWINVL